MNWWDNDAVIGNLSGGTATSPEQGADESGSAPVDDQQPPELPHPAAWMNDPVVSQPQQRGGMFPSDIDLASQGPTPQQGMLANYARPVPADAYLDSFRDNQAPGANMMEQAATKPPSYDEQFPYAIGETPANIDPLTLAAITAQAKAAREVDAWFEKNRDIYERLQQGDSTAQADFMARQQNDPFPIQSVRMLDPERQRGVMQSYQQGFIQPMYAAAARPATGLNIGSTLSTGAEKSGAGVNSFLGRTQMEAARALYEIGGPDFRNAAENQMLAAEHASRDMNKDADYIQSQLPQNAAGELITGQIDMGLKMGAGALATAITKNPRVGAAVFQGLFAADSAGRAYNDAKQSGKGDSEAAGDAMFSGIKAAIVSKLPMQWSALAKETAATQMAGAYLSGTAITTGDAGADLAWKSLVRGEKVDAPALAHVAQAFLQGGLPAAGLHGVHALAENGLSTDPMASARAAEPGFSPDEVAAGARVQQQNLDRATQSDPIVSPAPADQPPDQPSQPGNQTQTAPGDERTQSAPLTSHEGSLPDAQPQNVDETAPQVPGAAPRQAQGDDQTAAADTGGGEGGGVGDAKPAENIPNAIPGDYSNSDSANQPPPSAAGEAPPVGSAAGGAIDTTRFTPDEVRAVGVPDEVIAKLEANVPKDQPERFTAEEVRAVGVPDEVINKLEASNAAAQGIDQPGNRQERSGNAEGRTPARSELGGGVQTRGEVTSEAQPGSLTLEPHGSGTLQVVKAGPELTKIGENWEGKKLATYNKKAGGWLVFEKNAPEVQKVLDQINSERIPKPSAKEVAPESGPKPVDTLTDAEIAKEMNGATGGRLSKLIAERTKREREKPGFDVDPSLLGGVLQHSDTVAHYRDGDEKAGDQPARDMLGTASQALKATAHYIIDEAKRFKGSMFPTITRLGEESGNKAAELVSSKTYAKEASAAVSREIIGRDPKGNVDKKIDKLAGAFLTQDNLDSVQRSLQQRASSATDPKEAAKYQKMAGSVASLIGAEGSPFDTRTDFAKAGMNPKVQAVIARYKKWFSGEPEENFRASQRIAPDEELPTRGLQSGARVNLKAALPEDPKTATTVITSRKGNLTNPRLKASPFARMAKGNAPGYDISLSAMIENTLGKGTEIANQHRLYDQMVKDGIAKVAPAGSTIELGGKRAIPFELESARRYLVTKVGPEGEKDTTSFAKPAQKLYVRADAYGELRRALAVDESNRIPFITRAAEGANVAALASVKEAAFHIGNQITALAGSPGTGAIIPGMIKNMAKLWAGGAEVRSRLAELARIGALKDTPPAPESTLGKLNPLRLGSLVIHATDRAGRLLMDDAFTHFADKGVVKDTPQNRRDFINQFGQYNSRAQQKMISLARETGLGPFATAGTNFLTLGIKKMVLSPGMTATSVPNAIRLRALVLARLALPLAAVAAYNYANFGRMDGSANIPIGAVRLPDDKEGNLRYFDVLRMIGVTRGLRATGALAAIEGARRNLPASSRIDNATNDIVNSATSPFAGPLVRFGKIAATGRDTSGYQVADTAEKANSQAAQNIKAAVLSANPVVDLASGGKTGGQFGPFEVKTGHPDRTPAEMLLDQKAQDKFQSLRLPPEEKARAEARKALAAQLSKAAPGEINSMLNKAVADKTILPSQRGEIITESKMSPIERRIHGSATAEDVMEAWDEMSPAEQKSAAQAVSRKIAASKTMAPEQKRAAFDKVRASTRAMQTAQ